MDAVKVAILKNVKTREIELEDVINVVKVGEANKHLVEFAEALDVLCVQFVRSISTTKLSELFSSSQVEEAPLLYQLMSKVHKLKDKDEVKVTRKCMNCQQDPRPRQFRTKSADPDIHPACTLPPHLQQCAGICRF